MQGLVRADAGGDGGPRLRIGFTATKRVGHATERNRMRRRLRAAALEALRSRSDVPVDLVVIARRALLGADYRVLVADLERAVAAVARPKGKATSGSPTL